MPAVLLTILALRLVEPATAARSLRAPPASKYESIDAACKACMEFFPGGCRAGPCNEEKGPGAVPSGPNSSTLANPFCMTLAPVAWFQECSTAVVSEVTTAYDLSRYCSYQEKIFIPPPLGSISTFAGKTLEAYQSLDSPNNTTSGEKCFNTIAKNGKSLYDGKSYCDSNITALADCCTSVHQAFGCLQAMGTSTGVIANDPVAFDAVQAASEETMMLYKTYCLPMCQPLDCVAHPNADPCVSHNICEHCTQAGGQWCPTESACKCPQHPGELACAGAIEVLDQCPGFGNTGGGGDGDVTATTTTAVPKPGKDIFEAGGCKFAEMVKKWYEPPAPPASS